MTRFFSIVGFFLLYTAFEIGRLRPAHAPTALVLSAALFLLMLGSTFILRANADAFERRWFRALAWTSSLTMAVWMTFILLSIPVDVLGAVAAVARAPAPATMERIRLTVLAASAGLAAIGFFQVVRGPRVRRVNVHVPGLPAPLRGLRIAHFSDLHVGPTLRRGYVERVVKRINGTEADLVAFTGDLADGPVESIARHLEPLRQVKARYGSFYVVGNHEYYWGVDELVGKARELGFRPLLNDQARVSIDGAQVLIAGVTDPAGEAMDGHAPDLRKAAAAATKPDLKILLAHRPSASDEAEALDFDLQLSGHTHAGQFFPFSLLIGLFHRFTRGLYRQGRLSIYVNPGTGYWGPADRLGVASEISLLTLA